MEISHVPLILITYCNNFPHYQPSSPEQYICYSSSLHWYAVIIQSPQFIYLVLYSLCFCLVAKLCPTLCNPVDCNPPDSSVHGISQARTLEWVAMPFSRASSQPRDQTQVSCIAGRFLTTWATREAHFGTSLTADPPCVPLGKLLPLKINKDLIKLTRY